MDGSKVAALGWRALVAFEDGLPATVAWYREHGDWVAAARSGDWDAYYTAPTDPTGCRACGERRPADRCGWRSQARRAASAAR